LPASNLGELGFDIVMHSSTKYLNGHSDVIGGIAVVSGDERTAALREQLGFLHNAVGAVAGPFDSYLALRGVKTLDLRMQRHCDNARELAAWLESHSAVRRVRYPGLAAHPQHALAKRQMRDFGGMISFEVNSDLAGTVRFLEAGNRPRKLNAAVISAYPLGARCGRRTDGAGDGLKEAAAVASGPYYYEYS